MKRNPAYYGYTLGVRGLLMFSLLWSTTGFAAPITFNTALPVAQGEFLIRVKPFVSRRLWGSSHPPAKIMPVTVLAPCHHRFS